MSREHSSGFTHMPDRPSPALHKAEQTDWGILQELGAKWAHHAGEGGCASGRKGWELPLLPESGCYL